MFPTCYDGQCHIRHCNVCVGSVCSITAVRTFATTCYVGVCGPFWQRTVSCVRSHRICTSNVCNRVMYVNAHHQRTSIERTSNVRNCVGCVNVYRWTHRDTSWGGVCCGRPPTNGGGYPETQIGIRQANYEVIDNQKSLARCPNLYTSGRFAEVHGDMSYYMFQPNL